MLTMYYTVNYKCNINKYKKGWYKMGVIIDGKKISEEVLCEVKAETEKMKNEGLVPCLAVVLVGDDAASKIYVNNKKKACEKVGIKSEEYLLDKSTSEKELISLINELNNKESVSGILVQLPLPEHINEDAVINAISSEKDVDSFNSVNVGKLMQGTAKILPCTPAGIVRILDRENIEIQGKNCVVVGRSNIVGKPISMLLLQRNGTVTICHSKTKNLKDICRTADILIVAVGKEKFIKEDMIKENAVVIDVGINRMSNGKLCGDVDFEAVKNKCSYITPVPGGVGPMTIAMLMKNTVICCRK